MSVRKLSELQIALQNDIFLCCVCLCVYVCNTHILVYSYTHIPIHPCTQILIYSYTHILIYPYTHILIYPYTYILIYSYTHILIYSYSSQDVYALALWKLCKELRNLNVKNEVESTHSRTIGDINILSVL